MEDRGLNVNRKKTVYLRFNVDGNLDGDSDINLQGRNLGRVGAFGYLGATLAEDGDFGAGGGSWSTIGMERLEEGVGDSVRPKNKFESQGEGVQDGCGVSSGVRCRDLGSGEGARGEVACGGGGVLGWMSGVAGLDRVRNGGVGGRRGWEKCPRGCGRVG